MMRMATGEGSPLRQGAGTGLDWFSVATEACDSGTPDLSSYSMVLGYKGIYRRKKSVGGASRGTRGGVRAQGVRPLSRGLLDASLACTPSPGIASVPKITFPKVSFRLDSV